MANYMKKNTHEARNEALENGNEYFAKLIWDAWDECEKSDPMPYYDENDFCEIIEWASETNAELAAELEKEAKRVYG